MSVNRAIGIGCVVFGLLTYFVLIPLSISRVSFTHLSPSYIPILMSIILTIIGVLLIIQSGSSSQGWASVRDALFNRVLSMIATLIIYCIAMNYVGYILSTVIAVALLLWNSGVRRWLTISILSLSIAFGIWAFFRYLLVILLPDGLLFS
jgi:putative tricarboxylic transport membrane protein